MSRKYISDRELYELKERRMTYPQIRQYFKKRGIKISERQLARRFSKIYANRNKKVTRGSRISDEELYKLKERGLIYRQMVEYFGGIGIEISERAIIKRVEKIYADGKKKIPKGRPISDQELHELIEERKNCQKKRKNRSRGRIQVSDQELYRLKQKCMSYSAISKYLERKGIKLCPSSIGRRIREIYSEKGEKIPRGRKGRIYTPPELIEAIWNLKNTRNASDEQINKIAELYGVNLNRNVIKRTCDKFKRHRYW